MGTKKNLKATERFHFADQLFREGKYQAAFLVLDELDQAYPGTRHIMYAQALCLLKLDRKDEARRLFVKLSARFADPRARKALERLKLPPQQQAAPHVIEDTGFPVEDFPPTPRLGQGPGPLRVALWAFGLLALASLIAGVTYYFFAP